MVQQIFPTFGVFDCLCIFRLRISFFFSLSLLGVFLSFLNSMLQFLISSIVSNHKLATVSASFQLGSRYCLLYLLLRSVKSAGSACIQTSLTVENSGGLSLWAMVWYNVLN